MQERVKRFFNTERYQLLIEDEDWTNLFVLMHDEAMLENRYVQEIVEVLTTALEVDLEEYQEKAFVNKMKELLSAGYPLNQGYINVYKGIRLRPWLQSREWTNLYGLSLDDAINALIEADYNIEETPDMGTLLWTE